MGNLYHSGQFFVCMVFFCILNSRSAWSITRRGEFLACVDADVISTKRGAEIVIMVTECITNCNSTSDYVALSMISNLRGAAVCYCLENNATITALKNESARAPFRRCNATCPGNPQESCGGDSLWSVYKTTNRTCDDPGTPVNGTRIGDDFEIGSEVLFNCPSSLVADGPSVAQCWWVDNITLDIGWSSPTPQCVEPASLTTDEYKTGGMISSTMQPPSSNMGILVGSFIVLIVLIVVVVIVMVFMCKKRQKHRANLSGKSGPSSFPPGNTQVQLTQVKEKTRPKKIENQEDEVEDEDYLVPNVNVMAPAETGSGKGQTLQFIGSRPRLPAPPSVKASLTPEESAYQNSISIALSRSTEKLNKEAKENAASTEPAYQNRTVVTRQDMTRRTEGAVEKSPTTRTSSLPLDTDGIYQNTQITVRMSSPRLPLTATRSDGANRDSSGTASQRSSLNYRDSVDYITPNEATEQEVYENAGLMRPRRGPGPRRPPGQPAENATVVDSGDSDGVYLDLI